MALISYLIAFGHFFSELFIYRTAGLSFGSISPVIVSSECLYFRVFDVKGGELTTCLPRVFFFHYSHVAGLDVHAVRLLHGWSGVIVLS